MPTAHPTILTLFRNTTGQLVIKLRQKSTGSGVSAYDLSGFTTITITGDTLENPPDTATRLFTKAVATSGLTDAASGDLEFNFVDADWASGPLSTLTAGTYYIDIWGTDSGGDDLPITKGVFDFVMDLAKL